ncbi:molybdenum ABC transporter ATP-binding protein [Arthrobacter pityocampae]|uniref:Molybdenum ABC transporter ATP-binding protein n=1 Tax=Arthrobacter pityocampae TaxID=547334 RepID=A0A2S5J160_9MICC|nr:ATP-binding cassette domain-containing protein [Arthrobacter pityocampae]PPB50559.1 molybdenum ABC transporter ATP-binding protein [Arthrobacter pityocampae]
MSLTFTATLADRGFDVAFDLAPGETLAVLGPNGAGKSTLLGLLAGLLAPTAGRAELDGTVLFDVGPDRRTLTEPRHRGVSLLAQEALLFPHLTALENVAFGPRSRGVDRGTARATALSWLDRVGAADLAGRRPGHLSGGQAQRVAVARALAADPSLLLLDEPLSALDVTVAPALRTLLRDVLVDRSAIIVTHDPLDAFLLADRVLILDGGTVVESGATASVLTRPVTAFGAHLAGLNLVPGVRTADGFASADGWTVPLTDTAPEDMSLAHSAPENSSLAHSAPEGASLALAVRPGLVTVSRSDTTTQGTACRAAEVDDVEHRGDLVRLHAGGLAADVAPSDVVALGIVPGSRLFLAFRHEDASIYPL